MNTQRQPPALEKLAAALWSLRRDGLPARQQYGHDHLPCSCEAIERARRRRGKEAGGGRQLVERSGGHGQREFDLRVSLRVAWEH